MPEPSFAAATLGTFLDAAFGRITAARHAVAAGDSGAVLLELHSLKGLCAQAGELRCADAVHVLEERVLVDGAATPALGSGLDQIEAALGAIPGAATAPRTVPVAAVVNRVVGELRALAGRRRVVVRVNAADPSDDHIPRRTAGLLFDVLGHLARNAVVHGGRGGEVGVTLAIVVDEAGITCTLADDGTGAGRGDEAADVDAGRGLGLAAAAARVNAAGGRLDSAGSASGFCVTVWLPPDWRQTAGQG